MSWITRDFECTSCSHRFYELLKRSEDDGFAMCPDCGGSAERIVSRPNTMHRALPDGTDRGDNFKRAKEANDREIEMYDLPRDKRGDHKKEIKKLTGEDK